MAFDLEYYRQLGESIESGAPPLDWAQESAKKAGLPEEFWRYALGRETGGTTNPIQAVSPKGAFGTAQLMPGTAQEVGQKYGIDTSDPWGNVLGGAHYMREQLDRAATWAPDDEEMQHRLALAAYNAGPGRVGKEVQRFRSSGQPLTWEEFSKNLPGETRSYAGKYTHSPVAPSSTTLPPPPALAAQPSLPAPPAMAAHPQGNFAKGLTAASELVGKVREFDVIPGEWGAPGPEFQPVQAFSDVMGYAKGKAEENIYRPAAKALGMEYGPEQTLGMAVGDPLQKKLLEKGAPAPVAGLAGAATSFFTDMYTDPTYWGLEALGGVVGGVIGSALGGVGAVPGSAIGATLFGLGGKIAQNLPRLASGLVTGQKWLGRGFRTQMALGAAEEMPKGLAEILENPSHVGGWRTLGEGGLSGWYATHDFLRRPASQTGRVKVSEVGQDGNFYPMDPRRAKEILSLGNGSFAQLGDMIDSRVQKFWTGLADQGWVPRTALPEFHHVWNEGAAPRFRGISETGEKYGRIGIDIGHLVADLHTLPPEQQARGLLKIIDHVAAEEVSHLLRQSGMPHNPDLPVEFRKAMSDLKRRADFSTESPLTYEQFTRERERLMQEHGVTPEMIWGDEYSMARSVVDTVTGENVTGRRVGQHLAELAGLDPEQFTRELLSNPKAALEKYDFKPLDSLVNNLAKATLELQRRTQGPLVPNLQGLERTPEQVIAATGGAPLHDVLPPPPGMKLEPGQYAGKAGEAPMRAEGEEGFGKGGRPGSKKGRRGFAVFAPQRKPEEVAPRSIAEAPEYAAGIRKGRKIPGQVPTFEAPTTGVPPEAHFEPQPSEVRTHPTRPEMEALFAAANLKAEPSMEKPSPAAVKKGLRDQGGKTLTAQEAIERAKRMKAEGEEEKKPLQFRRPPKKEDEVPEAVRNIREALQQDLESYTPRLTEDQLLERHIKEPREAKVAYIKPDPGGYYSSIKITLDRDVKPYDMELYLRHFLGKDAPRDIKVLDPTGRWTIDRGREFSVSLGDSYSKEAFNRLVFQLGKLPRAEFRGMRAEGEEGEARRKSIEELIEEADRYSREHPVAKAANQAEIDRAHEEMLSREQINARFLEGLKKKAAPKPGGKKTITAEEAMKRGPQGPTPEEALREARFVGMQGRPKTRQGLTAGEALQLGGTGTAKQVLREAKKIGVSEKRMGPGTKTLTAEDVLGKKIRMKPASRLLPRKHEFEVTSTEPDGEVQTHLVESRAEISKLRQDMPKGTKFEVKKMKAEGEIDYAEEVRFRIEKGANPREESVKFQVQNLINRFKDGLITREQLATGIKRVEAPKPKKEEIPPPPAVKRVTQESLLPVGRKEPVAFKEEPTTKIIQPEQQEAKLGSSTAKAGSRMQAFGPWGRLTREQRKTKREAAKVTERILKLSPQEVAERDLRAELVKKERNTFTPDEAMEMIFRHLGVTATARLSPERLKRLEKKDIQPWEAEEIAKGLTARKTELTPEQIKEIRESLGAKPTTEVILRAIRKAMGMPEAPAPRTAMTTGPRRNLRKEFWDQFNKEVAEYQRKKAEKEAKPEEEITEDMLKPGAVLRFKAEGEDTPQARRELAEHYEKSKERRQERERWLRGDTGVGFYGASLKPELERRKAFVDQMTEYLVETTGPTLKGQKAIFKKHFPERGADFERTMGYARLPIVSHFPKGYTAWRASFFGPMGDWKAVRARKLEEYRAKQLKEQSWIERNPEAAEIARDLARKQAEHDTLWENLGRTLERAKPKDVELWDSTVKAAKAKMNAEGEPELPRDWKEHQEFLKQKRDVEDRLAREGYTRMESTEGPPTRPDERMIRAASFTRLIGEVPTHPVWVKKGEPGAHVVGGTTHLIEREYYKERAQVNRARIANLSTKAFQEIREKADRLLNIDTSKTKIIFDSDPKLTARYETSTDTIRINPDYYAQTFNREYFAKELADTLLHELAHRKALHDFPEALPPPPSLVKKKPAFPGSPEDKPELYPEGRAKYTPQESFAWGRETLGGKDLIGEELTDLATSAGAQRLASPYSKAKVTRSMIELPGKELVVPPEWIDHIEKNLTERAKVSPQERAFLEAYRTLRNDPEVNKILHRLESSITSEMQQALVSTDLGGYHETEGRNYQPYRKDRQEEIEQTEKDWDTGLAKGRMRAEGEGSMKAEPEAPFSADRTPEWLRSAALKRQRYELRKQLKGTDLEKASWDAVKKAFHEGKLNAQASDAVLRLIQLGAQAPEVERLPGLKGADWDKTWELLGAPRAFVTSLDLSYLMRQGMIGTAGMVMRGQWGRLGKALAESVKALGSEAVYKRGMEELETRDDFGVLKGLGIDFAKSEEQFAGARYAEKALKKLHLPNFVRGSERAFTYFLNRIRYDIGKSHLNNLRRMGFELDPVETVSESGKPIIRLGGKDLAVYEKAAQWTNIVTGRGGLPQGPGRLAKVVRSADGLLNAVLFSPRLMYGRMALFNPWTYVRVGSAAYKGGASFTKSARAVMAIHAADMVGYFGLMAGMQAGLMALSDQSEWETDMTSSDFGQVRIGNTRIDVTGGTRTYATALARLASQSTKTEYGTIKYQSPWDTLTNFLRGKLSPTVGTAVNLASNANLIGQSQYSHLADVIKGNTPLDQRAIMDIIDETGGQLSTQLAVPMIIADAVKLQNEHGWDPKMILPLMAGMVFGVGVSTREPREGISKELGETMRTTIVSPLQDISRINTGVTNLLGEPISVELTARQEEDLRKLVEKPFYETMSELAERPSFKQLPPEAQRIILISILASASNVREARGLGVVGSEKIRKQIQEDIIPEELGRLKPPPSYAKKKKPRYWDTSNWGLSKAVFGIGEEES